MAVFSNFKGFIGSASLYLRMVGQERGNERRGKTCGKGPEAKSRTKTSIWRLCFTPTPPQHPYSRNLKRFGGGSSSTENDP